MKAIKVAVLGACGWMGKVHTQAYSTMAPKFADAGATVEVAWLVDQDPDALARLGNVGANTKTGGNWQDAVNDPAVDLVDICLPDSLHYEVARTALENGKHVYCEKPLTDTAEQARHLAELARTKGLTTRVGHSFPVNSAHRLARELITAGEIGEVTLFRMAQHVDTHASPTAPFIWRLDGAQATTGIVGDTGSHVFSFMDYLVGEVDELVAMCPIVIPERPDVAGAAYGDTVDIPEGAAMRTVTNPDLGIMMCRFKNGAMGTVDFSRIATGKRFEQRYEIFGTKGAITYNCDQYTRLNVYSGSDAHNGFRAIDVGPEMPEYATFLPLANFGLGYNEVKTYEVFEVVESVVLNRPRWPTFDDGVRIVGITEACMKSHDKGGWVKVADGG